MNIKVQAILIISLLFLGAWFKPADAAQYVQKDGLFKMDIPGQWHWAESSQETIITFPDGKMVAVDIQWVPSRDLSQAQIKSAIKAADDRMIKEGVLAHHGTLLDNKEIKLDGVYATQLVFKTSPPNAILVTYISFFNKGNAFTVTYGSEDEKMHSMMDDVVETIKF
jgi:VCBS repeat-containing protein